MSIQSKSLPQPILFINDGNSLVVLTKQSTKKTF